MFGQGVSVSQLGELEASVDGAPPEALYQSHWDEHLSGAGGEEEEERNFCMLMESLGANNVFEE